MSSPPQEPQQVNQRASEWMHLGIDLMSQDQPTELKKAIACFDEAIALRLTLPLADNPGHRYGLAAGWMNRADALSRLGAKDQLVESVKAYDEALALLHSLPLAENPLYPRRMAIALINRGLVRQREGARADMEDAVRCFREALALLEKPAASSITDLARLRAGALVNLADVLIEAGYSSAQESQAFARQALRAIAESERTDRTAAATGFKARHVLCRAIATQSLDGKSIPPELVPAATAAVDGGLALARHWQGQGESGFRPMVEDLFRFGCRLHQTGEPRQLADFILECVDPERAPGVLPLNGEIYAAAVAALWSALQEIQQGGFYSLTTPRFENVLENLRQLRVAENRLEELRRAMPRLQTHLC